jgi:hypothetical protein
MKSILLTLTIVVFVLSTSANDMIKGDSHTSLSTYEIQKKGDSLYELNYANSSEKFTIEICPAESECCYLVRNEHVELMYVCSSFGFGLRKMPEKLQHLNCQSYSKYLNMESFATQSVLTPNKKSTNEALGIIACFLPLSVTNTYFDTVFNPTKQTDKLTSQR